MPNNTDNSPIKSDELLKILLKQVEMREMKTSNPTSILEKAEVYKSESLKWRAIHAAIHATERVLTTAIKETSEMEQSKTPEERMHHADLQSRLAEKGLDKLIPFVGDVIAAMLALKK